MPLESESCARRRLRTLWPPRLLDARATVEHTHEDAAVIEVAVQFTSLRSPLYFSAFESKIHDHLRERIVITGDAGTAAARPANAR
jgi:hypothetical protein